MAKYRYIVGCYPMVQTKDILGLDTFETDTDHYDRISIHDSLEEAIAACDAQKNEIRIERNGLRYHVVYDYYCVERQTCDDDDDGDSEGDWYYPCDEDGLMHESLPNDIELDMYIDRASEGDSYEQFEYEDEDYNQFHQVPVYMISKNDSLDAETARLFSMWLDWHGIVNDLTEDVGSINYGIPSYIHDAANDLFEQFCRFGK